MTDLIVIGAGPGGYEAAAEAARLGKSVLLLEKEALGGTCLNCGCIPTKALLRSAHALVDCRSAERHGVQGAAQAKLDFAAAQSRKDQLVAMLRKGVAGMLKRAGVEIVSATAQIAAPGIVFAEGMPYEAQNILIATGARPALPPIQGLAGNPVLLDSTAALALPQIPTSLAIIGAGVIGLEFAALFAACGVRVDVIEALPRIAPAADAELARRLLSELRRQGITFHLGCNISRVSEGTISFTDDAGAPQSLTAEKLLCATGRAPCVEELGLELCGVDFDRHGIRCDSCGRTNVPGIWACGDGTGGIQLAHEATRQGVAAVHAMFCDEAPTPAVVPSVLYTHPELAQVGETEEQLQALHTEYRKALVPMGISGRFLIEHPAETGLVKVLAAPDGLLLGIHILGGPAGELIPTATALLQQGLTIRQALQMVFPHPTIAEALKEALRALQ